MKTKYTVARCLVAVLAIYVVVPTMVRGQAVASNSSLAGGWEGTLGSGPVKLRIVLTIEKNEGAYSGALNSVDQNAVLPMGNISLKDQAVHFEIPAVGGVYDGTLSADGAEITGTWTQTSVPTQPLSFKRRGEGAVEQSASNAAASRAPPSKPLSAPLEITVPSSPTAFKADGKWHFAFELHIANFAPVDCVLTSIEVRSGDASGRSIANFTGVDLSTILAHPGEKSENPATIPGGRFAVAFLWVTVDNKTDLPATIRERVTMRAGAFPDEISLNTSAVQVHREGVAIISPPLRGDSWKAVNGPSNTSGHRRALIPIDGTGYISERFAIDWVEPFADGKTYQGDPQDNKSYRAYGAEIHSVADGVVTEVKDGIPQNTPGMTSRAVPITLETIGGNHVIVKIGPGRYAFYAHMQPGSIRVKLGDRVTRGQALGLVGNSGNSTEPHLHFDLCDGNSMLACEGIPYAFPSFETLGKGPGGKTPDTPEHPVKHEMEMPLENEIVRFPATP